MERCPYPLLRIALFSLFLTGACDSAPDDGGPGPIGPVGPQDGAGPSDGPGPAGDAERIPGSGGITVESREVDGFTRIELAGAGLVIVTMGESHSLEIEADDNLLEYLDTSVSGDTLTLSTAEGASIDLEPTDSITWRVGTPSLAGVAISGAGTIEAPGIDTNRFDVAIDGAGMVRLWGRVDRLDVTIRGAGTIGAQDLEARTAPCIVEGVGEVVIWVLEGLEVSASATSTISVYGEPEISGDASIVQRLGNR